MTRIRADRAANGVRLKKTVKTLIAPTADDNAAAGGIIAGMRGEVVARSLCAAHDWKPLAAWPPTRGSLLQAALDVARDREREWKVTYSYQWIYSVAKKNQWLTYECVSFGPGPLVRSHPISKKRVPALGPGPL